jgi:succinoglycan biosynthesis protein ExoA
MMDVRLDHLPPLPADAAVSVIIPARGAAGLLEDCLARVLPQLRVDDEVIVACGDRATLAAAEDLSGRDRRVVAIENPDGTTPAALNRAIAAARHPVILRVDAQARIPAGYRDRTLALLASTGAVNVGGRQLARADRGFAAAVACAMNSPFGNGGAAYRTGGRSGPVDTVYLGVFRADALALVGGYDEAFTTNQDAELNERLRRAGGTVHLDADLAVEYLPRDSVRALARQFFQYGRGRAATSRRHPGSLAPRQLAAPLLVATLFGALVVVPWTSVPIAGWAAGYGCVLVVGSVTARPAGPRAAVQVALALSTMHLAWGAGFLSGRIGHRR